MEELLEAVILAGGNDNDVEEAILIAMHPARNNAENPHYARFNLDDLPEEEVKIHFRFEKNHIPHLAAALGIPEQITTATRNSCSGVTAFCILLRRLVYPNRLRDLSNFFNLSPQSLSAIINTTTNIIMQNKGYLLENLRANRWLTRNKMNSYAQAINNKGGALQNCWGFIDGTARPICRPSFQQEEYYSGHKRHHCIKYQSVLCPDGIITSLKGAYVGRRHDAGIFRESRLYEELEEVAVFPDNNQRFVLYGDQAYGVMELLLCPYPDRRENLAAHEAEFNRSMKTLRVSVEWGFQKIVSLFAFVDYKKNQKLLLQDLESLYKVAVLLTNCHTCLYSSQSAQYFNLVPPLLNEYLN